MVPQNKEAALRMREGIEMEEGWTMDMVGQNRIEKMSIRF